MMPCVRLYQPPLTILRNMLSLEFRCRLLTGSSTGILGPTIAAAAASVAILRGRYRDADPGNGANLRGFAAHCAIASAAVRRSTPAIPGPVHPAGRRCAGNPVIACVARR